MFREFIFYLTPLALECITLIPFSGMFFVFLLFLVVFFLFNFIYLFIFSFLLQFWLSFRLALVLFGDSQFELVGLLLSGLFNSFFVCYLLFVFYGWLILFICSNLQSILNWQLFVRTFLHNTILLIGWIVFSMSSWLPLTLISW